jgi:hypothetical protein
MKETVELQLTDNFNRDRGFILSLVWKRVTNALVMRPD